MELNRLNSMLALMRLCCLCILIKWSDVSAFDWNPPPYPRDDPNGIPAWQLEPRLRVLYHLSPKWIYMHHPLQGVCSGFPDSDGFLEFGIYSKNVHPEILYDNQQYRFRIRKNSQIDVYKRSNNMAVVTKLLPDVMDTKVRRVNRTFIFKICPTELLRGGYFKCSTQDGLGRKWVRFSSNDAALKIRDSGDVVPSVPILKVYYQLTSRSVLIGSEMRVDCSAMVGWNGRLTLVMSTKSKKYYWRVTFYQASLNSINDRLECERYVTPWGERLDCILYIEVTLQMKGATFQCFAKDANGIESFFDSSPFLRIIHLPYYPRMTIRSKIVEDSKSKRPMWVVEGECKTPLTERMRNQLKLSVRTEFDFHEYIIGITGCRQMVPDRREVLSFAFTELRNDNNWLGVAFSAGQDVTAGKVTVTCKVLNLQRQRTVRSPAQAGLRPRTDSISVVPRHVSSLQWHIRTVVASAMGLLLVLLFALTARQVWRTIRTIGGTRSRR